MKQVGSYRILEEVGRGATGIVYRAADAKANRTVAVKAIRTDAAQKIDDSLLDALRSLRALSHSNIATLYDALQEKEQIYAIYEYAPGLSLEAMLRRLALPEKPALLRCFEQVAQALDYADSKGVVHRDVRPSNIILDTALNNHRTSGPVVAKITDFGVSQIAFHDMTSSGAMVGTPSYLSPEEIQGTPVDGRSDQFSLAVVIYEVLSGAKPFVADSLPGIFFQICKQPVKPVDEVNPSLTREVSVVLERALAKNPSQRFPSCADFVQALEKSLQEIPEWTAAVARPLAPPHVEAAVAAAPPLQVESAKRLPSLPKRSYIDEEADSTKPRKHSPSKLLALMLVLSAIVIALSVLWSRWDWHAVLPRQRSTSGESVQRPATADAGREKVNPQEQQQTTTKPPAPPPTDTSPAAKPSKASTRSLPPVQQTTNAPVPGATASIDLLSAPTGAMMVIDGNTKTSCVTPCMMSLPNGRHTAAVELNGYNVAHRVFNIPDDNSVIATLSRSTGTLVVTSIPPGAQILVDNKPQGRTPTTLHLSAGLHKLVLVDGSMQHEETIDIEGGELQSRSLRWQ